MAGITRAGRDFLDREQLDMFDPSKPWGGRSPRHLIKAFEADKLRREAATPNEEDRRIDEQYRRFLPEQSEEDTSYG